MFYRVKENKVSDYADFEYAQDCLCTFLCTKKEYEEYKDNYRVENGQIVQISDKGEYLIKKRQENFEKNFFETGLGWIRRKVTMKDGSSKDFLSDLLLSIKAGIELGQNVEIITYKTPDFTKELTNEYMKSLQEIKSATLEFISECLMQIVKDFGLNGGENNGI